MDVAGLPSRFCMLLDFMFVLANRLFGPICSLMIFQCLFFTVPFVNVLYANSIKVSNQTRRENCEFVAPYCRLHFRLGVLVSEISIMLRRMHAKRCISIGVETSQLVSA